MRWNKKQEAEKPPRDMASDPEKLQGKPPPRRRSASPCTTGPVGVLAQVVVDHPEVVSSGHLSESEQHKEDGVAWSPAHTPIHPRS